jgi:hypothetical protein
MPLERRDPVPPGRYSIFILPTENETWARWVSSHPLEVRVVVSVPRQTLASNTPVFATTWLGDILQNYAGSSVLFDVVSPVPWAGLGYPSIETGVSGAAFVTREHGTGGIGCYWVWTESGPQVVCDETGPARVSPGLALAPWLIGLGLGLYAIKRLT